MIKMFSSIHYNCYKQMMKLWHNKLPGLIYDCEYEKLAKNSQDNEIKELT